MPLSQSLLHLELSRRSARMLVRPASASQAWHDNHTCMSHNHTPTAHFTTITQHLIATHMAAVALHCMAGFIGWHPSDRQAVCSFCLELIRACRHMAIDEIVVTQCDSIPWSIKIANQIKSYALLCASILKVGDQAMLHVGCCMSIFMLTCPPACYCMSKNGVNFFQGLAGPYNSFI